MDQASGWGLRPLAAYQTSVRISDMAWNPHIPSFMAFVCEDGSLQMAEAASQVHSPRECRASAVPSKSRQALRYSMHQGMLLCPALDEVPGDEPGTFDTRTSLHQAFSVCIFLNGAEFDKCCCDVQVGPAKQISLGGDVFPLLQVHVVDGTQRAAGLRKHARLVCEWGQHPMTLLLAAGLSIVLCCIEKPSRSHYSSQQATTDRSLSNSCMYGCAGAQLLRYDIRQSGARCQPRVIHRLPDQDAFVALAPSCRKHAMACPEAQQTASCLLAASSLDCVLLLDLRRPSQALLKWPHGDMLRSAPRHPGLPMYGQPVKIHTPLATQAVLLLLSGLPIVALASCTLCASVSSEAVGMKAKMRATES